VRSTVIGFGGQIGSGKTIVAVNLASKLNCPVASFGSYVRKVASDRGLSTRREVLQELSIELLASLGAEGLTQNVLTSSGWDRKHSLVVDGIRHSAIVAALKQQVSPLPFLLIYLDVSAKVRGSRLVVRDNLSAKEIDRFERHSTEQDVAEGVKQLADIVINSRNRLIRAELSQPENPGSTVDLK
jgi:cytidylate kinase